MGQALIGREDAVHVDGWVAVHGAGDGLGFREHHTGGGDQVRFLLGIEHGGAGQDAERSGGKVEDQLLPDEVADPVAGGDGQAGRAEGLGELAEAGRVGAIRFAEGGAEGLAADHADQAGFGDRACRPGDAADGLLRTDPGPEVALRVEAADGLTVVGAAVAMEYHQGMPLVTKATAVSGPSSGAMVAATAGSAGALTVTITTSCGPRLAGSDSAGTRTWMVRSGMATRRPWA